ncbi:hypothetical protein J2X72_001076 [Phyllobacterium sp. 1468]|uniref:hypothetical protein n=1 Tax=Phyllobacterium sp. 1468 TaxID=2817759 RepID=UPI0028678222|nr:hypothetical protein [Phyllobacterium sp. 1468]MDR6632305.1 hypothetical protein [Phyllobacterium sp. 1468]
MPGKYLTGHEQIEALCEAIDEMRADTLARHEIDIPSVAGRLRLNPEFLKRKWEEQFPAGVTPYLPSQADCNFEEQKKAARAQKQYDGIPGSALVLAEYKKFKIFIMGRYSTPFNDKEPDEIYYSAYSLKGNRHIAAKHSLIRRHKNAKGEWVTTDKPIRIVKCDW